MAPAAPHRRTWPERVAIAATIVAAVVCFVAAGGLAAGYMVVRNRDVVEISNPAERQPAALTPVTTDGQEPTSASGSATAPPTQEIVETTTTETFPPADPAAKNFLITGADNGACVDPNSPYAPAFGDVESGRVGERSDTIMVFRVDPGASRMAVLSLPRDLFVTIAGTGNRARINSAYIRDEPQRLIDTIYENFGVGIDHFIQVDFCVPFDFAARDPNTGLNVPAPGCFTFDGDHALAYVRSRKYEFEYPVGSNEWHDDESSDLGRISDCSTRAWRAGSSTRRRAVT
jgi:LCP family protein required for cell wall assembly